MCNFQYCLIVLEYFQNMDTEMFEKKLNNFEDKSLNYHKVFCKQMLKIPSGARAIVVNGRVGKIFITFFSHHLLSQNFQIYALNCKESEIKFVLSREK